MNLITRTFLLAVSCLVALALTPARASETFTQNGLNITASAVDPYTFHIQIYPTGNPAPPLSPFVVETNSLAAEIDKPAGSDGLNVQTPKARILMHAGFLNLSADWANNLIYLADIKPDARGNVTFTIWHAREDARLYGAGNADMNTAGDLTHPAGTSGVSNGWTRIPFVWSPGGWSCLVANDETGIAWSDSAGKLAWTVPGSYADLYLSVAPYAGVSDGKSSPNYSYGLLSNYTRLTGRAPIPPKWAFGFMLSRWGYADAADVQDKWHQFRDRHIPVDAFIYDYDWFANDWEFNPKTFPNPKANLAEMKRLGLHFVGIRKPRVNGGNQAFARSQGWLLDSSQGTDLRFDVPASSYWWWSHHVPLVADGVAGWWNDEAEQSGDEFFRMAQTEYDGWRAMKNTRPWSISRAFAPGMQRFGAAGWTGDIDSTWAALQNQPGTLLNWSLAGFPYVGQDTGGFQSTPTPELYARWIEEAVFVPVMRAHGTYDSPRWPWAFGDAAQSAITKAIDLRYRLIPTLYTYAAQTAQTGAPLMRPLFLEYPNDPKTYNLEDEWLIGDRLLAAPVLNPGGSRDIYLPAGGWYQFAPDNPDRDRDHALAPTPIPGAQTLHPQNLPLDVIPAYVRAGSIVVLGPVLQSTALGAEDPLEIRVYPGADASFTLTEDDGTTYAYQHNAATQIPMYWNEAKRTLTVGAREGSFPGMLAMRHLAVVLPNGTEKTATYTGHSVTIRF